MVRRPPTGRFRFQPTKTTERLAAGPAWSDDDLVATSVGTLTDPSNFRRAFTALTTRPGLSHWHPHELRHSAVSLLSAAGVPLEQIADAVGTRHPDDGRQGVLEWAVRDLNPRPLACRASALTKLS